MQNVLVRLSSYLDNIRIRPTLAILFVVFIALLRYALEWDMVRNQSLPYEKVIFDFLDPLTYYIFMFLLFLAIQRLLLGRVSLAPITLGMALCISPILFDFILGIKTRYIYPAIDPFFISPGMSIGEIAGIYLGIVVFSAYIFGASKSWKKAALAILVGWAAFQFLASLYPLLAKSTTLVIAENKLHDYSIIFISLRLLLIIALTTYLDENLRKMISYRALRIMLILSFASLAHAIAGGKTAHLFAAIPIALASWMLALMVNNEIDRKEDEVNSRPCFNFLGLSWMVVGIVLCLSCLHVLIILPLPPIAFPIIIVAALAASLYSWPIKTKLYFPFQHFVQGIAYASVFLMFLLACGYDFSTSLFQLAIPVFFTMAIGSMIKDYKDVEGDCTAKAQTIFIILKEKYQPIFWLAYRIGLIIGPIVYAYTSFGYLDQVRLVESALFIVFASAVLFVIKMDKESLVERYIALFTLFLLAISII